MDYNTFIKRVEERGRFASKDQARRAAEATLETLAERLTETEAFDLAGQLPPELKPHLTYQGSRGPVELDLTEFYQQVAAREGTLDPAQAREHAHAVMAVLQEAVSRGEMGDLQAVLPKEYAPMFRPWTMPDEASGRSA